MAGRWLDGSDRGRFTVGALWKYHTDHRRRTGDSDNERKMRIEVNCMTGMFATSRAGHDKGKLYIIIEESEEYVYLTDGRLKPVDRPKKKKKKHIQIIRKVDETIQFMIEEKKPISNEMVKRAIKEYEHKLV